jgi:small-conductance mechanosensitive channel
VKRASPDQSADVPNGSLALPIGLLIIALTAGLAALLVRDITGRRFVRAACFFGAASLLSALEATVLAWTGGEADPGVRDFARRGLGVRWWLALAIFIVRGLELFLWRRRRERRDVRPVPKLLTGVAGALVYVAAIFIIVSLVFEQPIAGLFAASGLVAAIFGFALQNPLADLFSGIALNLDRRFHIGDWIRFGDIEGEEIEMNRRAARVRTRQNYGRVIPNGAIARATIDNFSLPDRRYALLVRVGLD